MLDELKAFAPGGRPALIKAIADAQPEMERAGINTPLRICHFMAQMFVESGGLRVTEENLNYSAKRLCAVWPKRFPTLKSAEPYAMNPRALANKVYGGRMGNVGPDDGWRFRGRGPKQVTGKDNYRAIGKVLGLDLVKEPDLLLEALIGVRAAISFWKMNGCNAPADKNDIRGVTLKVNGGYNGLADRRAAFRKAVQIWGDDSVSEIGSKTAARSNIGRASLLAGGLSTAGIGNQIYEVSSAVESGRSLMDALGVNFLTLILLAAVLGLVVYIFRDRLFISKHEGL
ncbi:glycoside hydrolase family 19 protein [Aminobacter anthyllidis]|uniref:Glycoside hydrolase family 19 protein n=1 Tax=Aminobacter anthyllidis TaxID=1035067 RepID=A0A9X1A6Y6_9HYPH|nr:glycoside hydrolase family 19 protein [Aminobacter anthyllidis]MBT1154389.1 glycoside hydrolase family 19 protein [Aminobacter anthyllidis]